MSLLIIAISFASLLILAYRSYGRFVSKTLGVDNQRQTPAHSHKDGVDFVPTKPFYLFAQHFSAIAAAGPIAGPIIAATTWGWLPCLVWIAFGVVLIGAVHDFASLLISVRHDATSMAQVAKKQLGSQAGMAMMAFMWLALVYVTVAFTDITAGSFVGVSEELLASGQTSFNPGGAVAMAAILYLSIAVIMGLVDRFFRPPLWLTTIIFVPLAFFAVWLGTQFSTVLILDTTSWCILILGYCAISSLLPVWLLLQPRGYLGGFILYGALFVGAFGMLFGNYEIKQPAFISWDTGTFTGTLVPFLFVTIACGACSGFHGLVCSGTTAKQVDKESHMKAVGYGAMLCEALVALIALACVMIWSQDEIAGLKPGTIYGKGIGEFLTLIIGEKHRLFAVTFGAMAFSTFVFDTLDVSTRLGRYLLQELFQQSGKLFAIAATIATVGIPLIFIMLADRGSYLQFWSLFGASNQLLAALSLLTISLWLYQAQKRIAFTLIPMLFVLVITVWSLFKIALANLTATLTPIAIMNGIASLALITLAIFLVVMAIIKVRNKTYVSELSEL